MATAQARNNEQLSFGDANVLLFDPVAANRAATRTALTTLGFRGVIAISDIKELERAWSDQPFDLLVADITQHAPAVCDMVRAMRSGGVGSNPFAHVVLMAWKLERDSVQRALSCGSDDLITRPFSVDFFAARVRVHTEARKPFVVTSEYLGPDRRKEPNRDAPNLITVPNLLLAKAREFFEGATAAIEEIRVAREKIEVERARKAAFKVACLLHTMRESLAASQSIDADMHKLEQTARDLSERSSGFLGEEACAVVAALSKTAAESATVGADRLNELDRHARALLQALYPSQSNEDLMREVAASVVAMKARDRKLQKTA